MRLCRTFPFSQPTRWAIAALGMVLLGSGPLVLGQTAGRRIDFSHDIAPVLKQHCVPCHGGDRSEGDFNLNTRESLLEADVVELGNASESRLWQLVRSTDTDDQMPPDGKPRLSQAQVDLIARWIKEGLTWQAGFSFADDRYEPPLLPRRPQLPPVVGGRAHPVDRLVDAYFHQHKLSWPRPLDDADFLRRVTFDLIGLPPTPTERTQFLADTSPDKRAMLVDTLLSRRADYAAHWMTYWNDLLRNSYSGTGFIDGGRKQITGWLYQSLYENKPYDQFVRELLAPSPASEGFIRGIKWRGSVNASQRREIQFAQSVAQVMLGINMKCASCHDSFIDRWTLKDAYGLAAVYAQQPLEIHRCDKPTGEIAQAAWIFPELGTIDSRAPQPDRLRQLAALMTHPGNGRLTRTIVNRIWRQLMGRGIVHPVDAMHTRPFDEAILDYLAADFADHDYDLKYLIKHIVTSRIYQSRAVVLHEVPTAANYRFRGPLVKRLTAEQYLDAIRSICGVWPHPGPRATKPDGRKQGGQLSAVLRAEGNSGAWGDRPVRTVFTFTDALQASLGRPNREQVVTVRPETMTTLEAINLANGPIMAKLMDDAAGRLQSRAGDAGAFVDQLFLHALCRPPSDTEQRAALELLHDPPTQQGIADLLWAIFVHPEFEFLP